MADFTNTVDVVGDEALADSIIERTITEFKDDHVLTVGQGAFCHCTALTTVNLPEATKIDGSSFVGCISLASVSIPKAQTISGYCFQNCTSLTFLDFPVLSSLGYNGFNYCTAFEAQWENKRKMPKHSEERKQHMREVMIQKWRERHGESNDHSGDDQPVYGSAD